MVSLARKRTAFRLAAWTGIAVLSLTIAVLPAFIAFDRAFPPPDLKRLNFSKEVVDADGKLLRAFANSEGRWRLKTTLDDVDPEYVKLLIAYEDKRFWSHSGVDVMALGRAVVQLISNGRIVSGGSTLTMQLARLLEPREKRSISSKLMQIVRAVQLEQRMTKREILTHYLMLAPYGGNLEGVRAASFAWFGKPPKSLTLSQAALLVALPQAPEARRPDRFRDRATQARNTVLKRASEAGAIVASEIERASHTRVSSKRYALPQLAPHLAQRALQQGPEGRHSYKTTLKRKAQIALEDVARAAAKRLDERVSIAMILADAQTGHILAEVGSPDFLDARRSGWVDMTRALRSPGSALKPFIYGLGFEEGVIRPETLMMDGPSNFAGYRPENFDMNYQGEVSVRQALQLSLNVPAVQVLEAVGPLRLASKMRKAGAEISLPQNEQPGLAIGLGGLGISLLDLTQLYTGLANGGRAVALTDGLNGTANSVESDMALLKPQAAWHVTDVLSGTPRPEGAARLKIAYKTGTSYGYRDAWSVGYDGRHVLGVWVGRADNGAVPGITGRSTAAPVLFEAFSKAVSEVTPFPTAPTGTVRQKNHDLPVTLQRFSPKVLAGQARVLPEQGPRIVFPPDGAEIELGKTASGNRLPLVVKLQDGRPPFKWLANGVPFAPNPHKRTISWTPDGSGFSTVTVIDAGGRVAKVSLFLGQDAY